jgi:hypothetical protein
MGKRKAAGEAAKKRQPIVQPTRKKEWTHDSLLAVNVRLQEVGSRFVAFAARLRGFDEPVSVDGKLIIDNVFDQLDLFLNNAEKALIEAKRKARRLDGA